MKTPHRKAPAWLAFAALGLAAATTAAGGEPLGTHLFAGYSFATLDGAGRHGASLALDFRALGPVAGFVDLGAHWGNQEGTSLRDVTLMAGPGARFGSRGGTAFFVRALAGVVRDKSSIAVLDVDISESSSSFGVLVGGGVDVRLSARFALRGQGDYLWRDSASGGSASCPPGVTSCSDVVVDSGSSDFRLAAGVVYRFGTPP